jgi:hydrogenase expression/formation protein HypC
MCIGIPMQILHIDGYTARATAKGVERDISLFMLPEDEVLEGDFVIVHLGYAIQKVSEENALSAWDLFDRILAETEG